MNRITRRGWLVAAAIFVLGMAVGGTSTAWFGIRAAKRVLQSPASTPGLADRAAQRIGADLTDTLKLTPEQSTNVQAVLNESAANLKAIRAQAAAQAAAELKAATQRIVALLPPEKHTEFYREIGKRYERLGLRPPQPESAH